MAAAVLTVLGCCLLWLPSKRQAIVTSSPAPSAPRPVLRFQAELNPSDYKPGTDTFGIKWRKEYSDLRVMISNPASFPVEGIEFMLSTDTYVTAAKQLSDIPNVYLASAVPILGATMHTIGRDGKQQTFVGPGRGEAEMCKWYRLSCPRIPPHMDLHIILATLQHREGHNPEKQNPKVFNIEGTYEFRPSEGGKRLNVKTSIPLKPWTP